MSTRRCTARSRHLAKPRTAPGSRVSHGMGSLPRASRTGSWESWPRHSRLQATGRRGAARCIRPAFTGERIRKAAPGRARARLHRVRPVAGRAGDLRPRPRGIRRDGAREARRLRRPRGRLCRTGCRRAARRDGWERERRRGGALGHRPCARVSGRSLARRARRAGVHRSGAFNAYRAFTQKFEENWKVGEMSAAERRWLPRASSLGLLSRFVVFGLIGGFLVKAAYGTTRRRRSGSTVRCAR